MNLSQNFLRSLEDEEAVLTQASDCINDNELDNSFTPVITNPVTCSQYVRVRDSEPMEEVNALDENIDGYPISSILDDWDDFDEELEKVVEKPKKAEPETSKKVAPKAFLTSSHQNTIVKASTSAETQRNLTNVKTSQAQAMNESIRNTTLDETFSSNLNESKRVSVRHKLFPVSSAPYKELGSFFGLTKRHKEFILKTKNIEGLYDWQEECLGLKAIHEKTNLIYALPTSGGKTLVAEIAMFREILLRKKNVIFVLPYVSIVQEKVEDLTPFAIEFNFIVEDYSGGKGPIPPTKRRKNAIYVCTIEKSQILFDNLYETCRLSEIGLIVVDELHMVGDENRGFSLETLLAKAVYQKKCGVQVIGMSATISNLRQIAKFLRADIYTRDFRPVELKEYVKIGSDILSIHPNERFTRDAFKVERTFGADYSDKMTKRDPDHVVGLVLEVIPNSSCLVFCATKQHCENVAKLLASLLPKELQEWKKEEKSSLIESMKSDGRICSILEKTITFGVAYHHSGLTSDERKHLEEAFRLNIICVICCTSTLAAGVNLPAQRVIIRTPYVGASFLTLTRYKQMVGRAGRKGKCDTGESIMICDSRDHDKLKNLLCSEMDRTVSAFVQDESGKLLRRVVMNLIGTKLSSTVDELVQFFNCSLLRVQTQYPEINLRKKIVQSVRELMTEGALSFTSFKNKSRNISFTIKLNGEDQDVYPDDMLEVSKLGKAAVNAGLTLEDAQLVEIDLIKAQEGLVLTQCLHMLFIVAPRENIESINFDNTQFNNILMRLEPSLMKTAKIVGITENLAMKMITRPGLIKSNEKALLKRFYIALMLFHLWNGKDVHEVASLYKVNRGVVYNLMTSASSRSYGIFKFCEVFEEFWMFKHLLENFCKRLCYCCSAELLPLVELPAVKIVR